MTEDLAAKLAQLREPFELDEIELLPRYTGQKNAEGKVPREAMKSCPECGGIHGFPCVHLSYVGHAGVTTRLLNVDPEWDWEPVATNEDGTPKIAQVGKQYGMWIRLTVLGIMRLGFGDAGEKTNLSGSAVKEIIGDAIRNAAMRFGVGTYLWSKSEAAKAELTRQGIEDDEAPAPKAAPKSASTPRSRKAPRRLLEQLRALRVELGVSDEKYAEQLEAAAHVSVDTDLPESAAVRLLAIYEERKASQTAPAPAAKDAAEPDAIHF